MTDLAEVIAVQAGEVPAGGFPGDDAWSRAQSVRFSSDWQGRNDDAERTTVVRLLWSPEMMFIRFDCDYRELVTFSDSEPDGYRDELWDRDVAEVFFQPDRFGSRHYTEFEVAPNGMWIDLEIFPGGRKRLRSGLRRSVSMDEKNRMWTAQLAIPMKEIAKHFDPANPWRVNFFRCEGTDPGRWYSAWRPTFTPEPAFHVPEAFGVLRFQ